MNMHACHCRPANWMTYYLLSSVPTTHRPTTVHPSVRPFSAVVWCSILFFCQNIIVAITITTCPVFYPVLSSADYFHIIQDTCSWCFASGGGGGDVDSLSPLNYLLITQPDSHPHFRSLFHLAERQVKRGTMHKQRVVDGWMGSDLSGKHQPREDDNNVSTYCFDSSRSK